jgi:hypothetical protein
MITTVVLGSVTIKCNVVDKQIVPKIAVIEIPGREGDLVQNLGNSSKAVRLQGILTGTSKDTDKSTLEGYKGTTQTYTDTDESFTMIVTRVNIPTIGGQPNHYTFTIEGRKYDQT